MFNVKPICYYKTILDIPDEILGDYSLICFDLDNTLDLPVLETTELLPGYEDKLNNIKEKGLEVIVLTNNSIENRTSSFEQISGLTVYSNFKKPFQKGYLTNSVLSCYEKNKILFVGDKMVTDMLGAKWYGADYVLVDQIVKKNDKWYSKFMGFSEVVFCFLNGFKKGVYYDKKM